MKIFKRKLKKYKTKKLAEKELATLGKLRILKKPKYSLLNVSEDNEIMTEKEITTKAEMVEDKDVDSTLIHFCDHDSPAGGCKLLPIEEAKEEFKEIKKIDNDYKSIYNINK